MRLRLLPCIATSRCACISIAISRCECMCSSPPPHSDFPPLPSRGRIASKTPTPWRYASAAAMGNRRRHFFGLLQACSTCSLRHRSTAETSAAQAALDLLHSPSLFRRLPSGYLRARDTEQEGAQASVSLIICLPQHAL